MKPRRFRNRIIVFLIRNSSNVMQIHLFIEPRRSESILQPLHPHVQERNPKKREVYSILTMNCQNTVNCRKLVNVYAHGLRHALCHVPHHDRDLFHGHVPAHVLQRVSRVLPRLKVGTNRDLHRLFRHVVAPLLQRRRKGSTRKERKNKRVKGARNKKHYTKRSNNTQNRNKRLSRKKIKALTKRNIESKKRKLMEWNKRKISSKLEKRR